ncbi:MAG: class I SAM-dependent methyltransferase [Myxococcota bacterium]
MERILEPEVMDGPEQCHAYATADFKEPNKAFVGRFQAAFPDFRKGTLLDLGCGPADIPIRLCRLLPELHITAVDASAPMLDFAREAAHQAHVGDRLTLVQDHMPCTTLGTVHFDGIISNSLLHHLPDPDILWGDVVRYGAPGAALLVVDLMRPPSRAEAQRLMEMHSNNEPDVLRRDFYNSLLAAFTPEEVRTQLGGYGLHALTVTAISDRHLAVVGRLPQQR